MRTWWLLAFWATIAAPACKKPVDNVVDTITVRSFFTRKELTQDLTIRRSGAGYTDGKRAIDEAAIRALVEAMSRPPIPKLDPRVFQIGAGDIHAALEAVRLFDTHPTSWFSSVEDPHTLGERIREYYEANVSGDVVITYASVHISVRFRDGHLVRLSAISMHELMLPWTVDRGDESADTYDPALSKAIAALLPEGFLNRDRISGVNLGRAMAEVIQRARDPRPEKATDDPFLGRFDLTRPITGQLVGFNAHGEDGWSATVTAPDWKPVYFDLFLRRRPDGSYDTARFLGDAGQIVRRVRAVPLDRGNPDDAR